MGLKTTIIDKAFGGRQDIWQNVITNAGIPSSITAPVGTLCWDTTNEDAYICTVADTTWVKINA